MAGMKLKPHGSEVVGLLGVMAKSLRDRTLRSDIERSFMHLIYYYFLFIYGARVEPSPILLQSFIGLLYQPWMIDGDDCGAIGGMIKWQVLKRKPAPVPLCLPQIPHDLSWRRTWTAAVASR
jgi:hypothetical protein